MNIIKNMEAIFLVVTILFCATSYASAAIPKAIAAHQNHAVQLAGTAMPLVTISAKRLSAAEKAQAM